MEEPDALRIAMIEGLAKLLKRPVHLGSQLWSDLKVNSDVLPELVELIEKVAGVDMHDFDWMRYVPAGWAVGPGEIMWTKVFGAKVSPISVADLCEHVRLHGAAHGNE